MNSIQTPATTGRTSAIRRNSGVTPKCKHPRAKQILPAMQTLDAISTTYTPKTEYLSLFFTMLSDHIDHAMKDKVPDSDIHCSHSVEGSLHRFMFQIDGAGYIELNICEKGGAHGNK